MNETYSIGNGQTEQLELHEKALTLNCMHDQQAILIGGANERNADYRKPSASIKSAVEGRQRISGIIEPNGNWGGNCPMVKQKAIVRRLTPIECERLQGFEDDYTNIGTWIDSKGKKHKSSDAYRYKALGNGLQLPFWQWLSDRIVEQLKKDGTDEPKMASLFSGIGGFELVFSRSGCEPVWASEVEEFCIAVTKIRFPEKEE